jgi:hypothetical protein
MLTAQDNYLRLYTEEVALEMQFLVFVFLIKTNVAILKYLSYM